MKGWFAAVFFWSCFAQAEHVLTFAQSPAPAYPRAMRMAGVEGTVRLAYQVDSRDGSISQVTIKRSDHVLFSDAVKAAIAKARFVPWQVAKGEPVQTDVVQDLVFRMDEQSRSVTLDAQADLMQLQCNVFNLYLSQYRQIRSGQPLWQMDSVAVGIGMLAQTSRAAPTLVQFEQAQQALEAALPSIEQRCAGLPDMLFINAWPQPLRDRALKPL